MGAAGGLRTQSVLCVAPRRRPCRTQARCRFAAAVRKGRVGRNRGSMRLWGLHLCRGRRRARREAGWVEAGRVRATAAETARRCGPSERHRPRSGFQPLTRPQGPEGPAGRAASGRRNPPRTSRTARSSVAPRAPCLRLYAATTFFHSRSRIGARGAGRAWTRLSPWPRPGIGTRQSRQCRVAGSTSRPCGAGPTLALACALHD